MDERERPDAAEPNEGDERPPPGPPVTDRWARSTDRAGAALLVVGCLGTAAWAWTAVRTQYELGGVRSLPLLGADAGLADRIDVFVNQLPVLLFAGVVGGIGIALRSFASASSEAARSAGGSVFRRPFGPMLLGAAVVLALLLVGAMSFGEDESDERDRFDLDFDRTIDEEGLPDLDPGARPTDDVDETTSTTSPEPTHTLEVHTDGCGVIRSGEIGEDLTWVVEDRDGFQVLGRNAAGETRYRYYRPGTYTVVLEGWNGQYHAVVSNEVTITC